jgi:hypothetical protein
VLDKIANIQRHIFAGGLQQKLDLPSLAAADFIIAL